MLGPAVLVRRFGAWASCLVLLQLGKVWRLSDLKLPVPFCNQTQSTLLCLPPLCHCMQDKRASPLIHLHSLSSEYLQGDVVCNSSSLSSGLFSLLVHHLLSELSLLFQFSDGFDPPYIFCFMVKIDSSRKPFPLLFLFDALLILQSLPLLLWNWGLMENLLVWGKGGRGKLFWILWVGCKQGGDICAHSNMNSICEGYMEGETGLGF